MATTKAEVVAALARTLHERDLLEMALAAAMEKGWEATERATIKGDARYTFHLIRAAGAMGGVVVWRFDSLSNRQEPQYFVCTLDRMGERNWPLEIAPALDRLRAAARRIQDAA
jgi:hypothetical protein